MADISPKYHLLPKGSTSVFPPISPIKMLGLLEEPNNNHINTITTPLSQFYQPEPFDDFPDNNVCVHETVTCPPQGTKAINNGTSICTKVTCPISSSSSDKVETAIIVKQVSQLVHSPPTGNKRKKVKEGLSSISSQANKKMEEMKAKKQKKEMKKDKKKATEETPTGYIHVRARRGQATDSHSLAERVRREKISERMKILQALVPGCDKVNGKALMLDEIINYVQSLQHQVEFLSMKLATVNPMYHDFTMDIDTLMVTTEQRLTALASPRPPPPPPSMQPCNGAQQIAMPNSTNPLATSSIFGSLDNSASLPIHHQELLPIIPPRFQGSGQHLWDFDDQIVQKLVNQQLSEFTSY